MNPWPFVVAAYAVALLGTAALLIWAWRGMKRAERAATDLAAEGRP